MQRHMHEAFQADLRLHIIVGSLLPARTSGWEENPEVQAWAADICSVQRTPGVRRESCVRPTAQR